MSSVMRRSCELKIRNKGSRQLGRETVRDSAQSCSHKNGWHGNLGRGRTTGRRATSRRRSAGLSTLLLLVHQRLVPQCNVVLVAAVCILLANAREEWIRWWLYLH